jgi:hypothetical protein
MLAELASLGVLAAAKSSNFVPKICHDSEALTLDQKNQRGGLGYLDDSARVQRCCGAFSFYSTGPVSRGFCQILSGATVVATAVCTSFARKA